MVKGGYRQVFLLPNTERTFRLGAVIKSGVANASSGPRIHDLYVEDGRAYITFSPSVRVTMTTACRHTEVKYADPGLTVTSADFPIHGNDGYIRFTVLDSAGHPAYTRAYFLDEIKGI